MNYLIITLVAVSLLLFDILKNKKKKINRLNIKKKKINFNNIIIIKLDKIVNNTILINSIRRKSILELSIINGKSEEFNNTLFLYYLLFAITVPFLFSIVLVKIFTMWFAIISIILIMIAAILYLGRLSLNAKINKIYDQFPESLQIFIDEYIVCKNIKKTLDNSYKKMPTEIQVPFEKLSRELSSGNDYTESIMNFANALSFNWTHAFAEILIMSLKEAGDISEDLLFLNELISDEQQSKVEDKTELSTNNLMFIILNVITFIILIVNILINEIAQELYFLTSTGNLILICWFGTILFGAAALSFLQK